MTEVSERGGVKCTVVLACSSSAYCLTKTYSRYIHVVCKIHTCICMCTSYILDGSLKKQMPRLTVSGSAAFLLLMRPALRGFSMEVTGGNIHENGILLNECPDRIDQLEDSIVDPFLLCLQRTAGR